MHTDPRGHTITTTSKEAATKFSDAVEMFIQRQVNVVPVLQESIEADPHCAMSQATFGLMLHGARNAGLKANMHSTLEKAQSAASGSSHREQHYINALSCACDGDLFATVDCFEKILKDNPNDLLALTLAQGELFWLGEMQHSSRLSTAVAKDWQEDIPGFSEFLAVRAFDLEETGNYKEAEAAGRQAVSLRHTNIWGAHAVAHVLLMQGRHKDGLDWLTNKHDSWTQTNQMKFHIWWHQCLFHLERKEHDAVLEHYDRWVRNRSEDLVIAMPDLYIDIQNGASMLWRLELAGIDVGDRWQEMAELAIHRLDDMSSPFTSAHYAVILAATGQLDQCEQLIEHMRAFSTSSNQTLAQRYLDAAIPAAVGAVAHRKGDYEKTLSTMLPARHQFWQMGGSHAQQDLFHQIMVDAAVKLKQQDTAALLLQEIEAIGFTEPARNVAYEAAGNLVHESK